MRVERQGQHRSIPGRPWQAAWHVSSGDCPAAVFRTAGVHHNGQRVRDETIADLAGVRIAYLALEKSMQTHPVPVVDGFSPEQQFFISWGQAAGHAMRLEAQRQLVRGDPHPVPKFRALGPLSNTPQFQQAFSCQAGAPMVRPPTTRCQVW